MKYSKKKILPIFLILCLIINVLATVPTIAGSEDNTDLTYTIKASKTDVNKGDTIKITVGVKNFNDVHGHANAVITTMALNIPIDTNKYEFVPDSITREADSPLSAFAINGSTGYNSEYNEVRLVAINKEIADADYNAFGLFSFEVKVKEDISATTTWDLSNVTENMASCLSSEDDYHFVTGIDADTINVHTNPVITLNDAPNTNAEYTDSVTVNADCGTATINGKSVSLPTKIMKNGEYKVEVSDGFGNKSTENFTINMPIKGIELFKNPTLEYIEGKSNTIDVTDGKIKIIYSSNGFDIIDLTNDMCSGYNLNNVGTQTVTVTYGGKTTQFNITVVAKSVDSISIENTPEKTVYENGSDSLDVTGGKIRVKYDNDTYEIIDMTQAMCTLPNMNTWGTHLVKVEYKGSSTTYEINVTKKISSISVTQSPTDNQCLEGMKINLAGGLIKVVYEDNSTQTLSLDSAKVTYDNTTVGEKNATVEYGGKTTTFPIKVLAKQPTKIAIKTSPKISYKEGDAFSIEGGVIEVSYDNNTKEDVNLDMSMIDESSPDMSVTTSPRTVGITYLGYHASYTYTVAAKELTGIVVTKPTKTTYIEGNALDTLGGKVKLEYDNNTSETIDMTNDMCSNYNMNKVGSQSVTVTYGDFSGSFDIIVKAKQVTSILIKTQPTILNYIEQQDLNLAGGVITVNYDNGTSEDMNIASDMVTGCDMSKIGNQTVEVTYEGSKAYFSINIKEKTLTGITISSEPTKEFIEKTEFNVNNGKLRLSYDNGKSEDIDMKTAMCSGYDMSVISKQTVTVTYGAFSTTYNITVKEKSLESISVSKQPSKTTILEGKNLDITDGQIELLYDNGETAIIDMTNDMISDFNNNLVGKQTINIVYQGKTTILDVNVTAKSVTAISMVSNPTNTDIIEGLDIDTTGASIKVEYDNDTTENIDVTSDMLSGFDNTKLGEQTVTVTYGAKTTQFGVKVIEKSISDIKLQSITNEDSVLINNELDSNFKVLILYNNNTQEEKAFKDVKVDGFDKAKAGKQAVKVTYKDFNKSFDVTVLTMDNIKDVTSNIDSLNVDALTLEDKEALESLVNRYNSLTILEKNQIKNVDKLNAAVEKMNSLSNAEVTKPDVPAKDNADTNSQTISTDKNNSNIVSANTTSPKTGDNFGTWKYLILAVSMEIVVGILIFKKKKFIED